MLREKGKGLGTYNTTTCSAALEKRCSNYHIPTLAVANVAGLLFMLIRSLLARSAYKSPQKTQLHQFYEVAQCSHPPGYDVDITRYTASLLECDNRSIIFGVLLNKSLHCMFPDPFLPRVVVTVSKGSGYARLCSTHVLQIQCNFVPE